ncbi:MAG: DUF6783 domain-containing protein [Lachnospiraceae bacterium]
MYVTICGRFYLNEGGAAGCVNRMKAGSPAKWGVQIAGIIFQTRSRVSYCTYRVKEVLPTKKGGGRITAEILAETGLSQDGHRQISQGSPSCHASFSAPPGACFLCWHSRKLAPLGLKHALQLKSFVMSPFFLLLF